MAEQDHARPEWRDELSRAAKGARLPKYLDVKTLPALVLEGDGAFELEAGVDLCKVLARDAWQYAALLDRVSRSCTLASREQFGLALLDVWELKGHSMTYDWLLGAQRWFAGDAGVVELEVLIDRWVFGTTAQRDRACRIVQVLGDVGTSAALTIVDQYRQNERSPKLHTAALGTFRRVANERGVSVNELEDMIVPDYGLDASGTRVFDYGPRQFELVFRERFYPCVSAADGKITKSLPRPRKTDDPDLVQAARDQWGAMIEHLKRAVRVHRTRLERRMISGYTMRASVWREVILEHPFMRNFARNLVWGVYSERDHALLQTFCVMEDLELFDLEDETVHLEGDALIGLPHPLDLGPERQTAWAQVFADDERFEPFDQLSRSIFEVNESEELGHALTRYAEATIQPRTLRTYFKYEGFERGEMDASYWKTYIKRFTGTPWSFEVHLSPGLDVGSYDRDREQSIPEITFRSKFDRAPAQISEVPEKILSEALRDVESMIAREHR